jgi:hypothetical protein
MLGVAGAVVLGLVVIPIVFSLVRTPGIRLRVAAVPRPHFDNATGTIGTGVIQSGTASTTVVCDGDRGIALRTVQSEDLCLRVGDAELVWVKGVVELTPEPRQEQRSEGNSLFGLVRESPIDWHPYSLSLHIGPGDRVEIRGERSDELAAVGYRDGRATVYRGQPGRPVVVRKL